MKNFAILTCIIILHASAMAREITCIDKLLPFNRTSGLHQLTKDEWNDGREILDSDMAMTTILFLTNSKLMCKSDEVKVVVLPVCNKLIDDLSQSNTCFAFTNLGYFIITRDPSKNLNFIFSRDKRFEDPVIDSL